MMANLAQKIQRATVIYKFWKASLQQGS